MVVNNNKNYIKMRLRESSLLNIVEEFEIRWKKLYENCLRLSMAMSAILSSVSWYRLQIYIAHWCEVTPPFDFTKEFCNSHFIQHGENLFAF